MARPVDFVRELFPARFHDRIFLVGGVVRDLVLGEESEDLDLAAAMTPDELDRCGFRFVDSKSAAPIHFLHVPPFGKVEVTRLDGLRDLPADLRRRDFTANAMAMDLSGALIDPLEGKPDAEGRRIRHCSPAAFLDDPIRIFRAFRMEADGWRMLPACDALLRESVHTVPDALADIPVERFSREMLRALAARDPARFFRRMSEIGIGERFLPELFRMRGLPADPKACHAGGNLFTHSILVLERVAAASPDPMARFCALFHDLGKLPAEGIAPPISRGHDEAGFRMAPAFCDRLRLPVPYRRALSWCCRHHGKANRWNALNGSTRVKVAMQAVAAGIEEILPAVSAADQPGHDVMPGWADALRVARMKVADLGVEDGLLETMPPDRRAPFLLRRRVKALAAIRPGGAST